MLPKRLKRGQMLCQPLDRPDQTRASNAFSNAGSPWFQVSGTTHNMEPEVPAIPSMPLQTLPPKRWSFSDQGKSTNHLGGNNVPIHLHLVQLVISTKNFYQANETHTCCALSKGHARHMYLDDLQIMGTSLEETLQMTANAQELLQALGFLINWVKPYP